MDQDGLFDDIAALQAALARDLAAQARAERACSYAAALAAVGEALL